MGLKQRDSIQPARAASGMKTFDALRAKLRDGTTTCEKITEEYLKAIEEGKDLHAFLEVYTDDEDKRREAIMKRIHKMLDEREKYYLAADMVVDTEGKSPDDVAREIQERLSSDGKTD